MMETIANCLNKANNDSSVHAVIIRNNGDHFCSGIDYSELIDCSDKQEYKAKVAELCAAIRLVYMQLFHKDSLFVFATLQIAISNWENVNARHMYKLILFGKKI